MAETCATGRQGALVDHVDKYWLSFVVGMVVLLCMTAIAANSFRRGMEGLGRGIGRGIHAGGRDLGNGIRQGMVRAATVRLLRTSAIFFYHSLKPFLILFSWMLGGHCRSGPYSWAMEWHHEHVIPPPLTCLMATKILH